MSDSVVPSDPDRPNRAALRASDADRTLVHDILSAAMTQGHLSPLEFEERSSKAVLSKTFGELDELTDDLPVSHLVPPEAVPSPARSFAPAPSGRTPVTNRIAIMSGTELKGDTPVGSELEVLAVMGGAEIDLRGVEFTQPQLTIRAIAFWGGIEIVVPPEINLEITGTGIMGGFDHKAAGRGVPGAPSVTIAGAAIMGGVEIVRRKPKSPDLTKN